MIKKMLMELLSVGLYHLDNVANELSVFMKRVQQHYA